jgi:hypothetical protein
MLTQSVGVGLSGAKLSHVTEKKYLMQFILHIRDKILKAHKQLKQEQYSMIRATPDWLLYYG